MSQRHIDRSKRRVGAVIHMLIMFQVQRPVDKIPGRYIGYETSFGLNETNDSFSVHHEFEQSSDT